MQSRPRRLFLIFHGRFPSEKAASLFVAKNAEAFADKNIKVILIVPRRIGRKKESPYSYYHVKNNFRVVYLPVIDFYFIPFWRVLSFWFSFASFSVGCFFYLLLKASRPDIIYSNESLPLFLASFIFPNTFYEMHDFPESKLAPFSFFIRRMKWVLAHNMWKAERVKNIFKVAEEKILCEQNAEDIEEFDTPVSKEEAREELGLPKDKKIAVYTGHLYGWKGTDTLAEATGNLGNDYLTIFVGGTKEDIAKFKNDYGANKNILIAGFRPHSEISLWQKAADVLVLPNTAKEDISKYYTSPMKIFGYAASRRPIVASRIPSIMELVGEKSAFLVNPDDPEALARGIEFAALNKEESISRSDVAYEWVKDHTWEKRAGRVADYMNFQEGE